MLPLLPGHFFLPVPHVLILILPFSISLTAVHIWSQGLGLHWLLGTQWSYLANQKVAQRWAMSVLRNLCSLLPNMDLCVLIE